MEIPDNQTGAAVKAEALGVKGPRGWAFRGVAVDAAPGALVALAGPSGSGRTCLLLALTGRMRTAEGHAEVAGLRLPRKMAAVRRISALAHVPGVADLDPALTVAEHLRERALLRRRFGGSPLALLRPGGERAAENRRRIAAALEAAGLDPDTLPKGVRTSVRDLERLEALRLSVALALIGEPRLLAVDDTDLKLGDEDEAAAWAMLRAVADSGVTVLAVCTEAPEQADTVVHTAVRDEPKAEPDDDAHDKAHGDAHDTDDDTDDGTHDEDDDNNKEGAADALAETGRA
ncbi:ATP-binding cassette domain-containing protein [Streptomyces sp. TRM64462]|uniref:ATP-binding cassette domain-containing protein n=1 Tax=Streptomyces sp. TRM64462 TaxID=2741726 RepID=UPI0015867707|nr:ATP-binding cassette domain-containing protein [Streptomyces sp. TRM64462]